MGGFGFDFGGGDDLGALLDGLVAQLVEVIEYIWDVLVEIAQYLLNLIVTIAQFLVSLAHALENILTDIIHDLYEDIIKPIIGELVKIEHWIANLLSPVLSWLYALEDWIRKYILGPFQIVSEIISRIRVLLSVLRLLGVQWAAKLDADLQLVQNYINTYVLGFVQEFNALVSWIQLLSDPTQIIRKQFWQNTAFSGLGEIYKAANIGSTRPVTPGETAKAQANLSLMNPATPPVVQNADGSVTIDPAMQDIINGQNSFLTMYASTTPGYTGPQ